MKTLEDAKALFHEEPRIDEMITELKHLMTEHPEEAKLEDKMEELTVDLNVPSTPLPKIAGKKPKSLNQKRI